MAEPAAIRRRPWVKVTLAVTVAVLLSASAFYAGTITKSPEQRAADAAPPTPSIVTVPIESRTLRSVLTVWCSSDYSRRGSIVIQDEPGSATQVLTDVALDKKNQVASGKLILAINNRPRIAARIAIPLFRDLGAGDSGADVKALQRFLRKLGYDQVATSGIYDIRTGNAIDALYRGTGYAPEGSKHAGDGAGARVNAREIVPIGASKLRIEDESLRVGKIVQTLTLTTLSGKQGLTCAFGSADIPAELRDDDKVILAAGQTELGTVVSSKKGTSESDSDEPAGGTVATAFVSINPQSTIDLSAPVQVQIITGESEADALIVPAAALWTKASAAVVTLKSGDDLVDVPVEVTFSAAGEAAITPSGDKSLLSVGDLVVVSDRS